jgi:LysM domain-containing protein
MTAAFNPAPSFITVTEVAPVTVAGVDAPVSAQVYRRRRLVVLAVVVGVILGLASFGRQADATRSPEATAAQAVLVVVQPGDTLWGIAQALAPDADPRPLVAALGEIAGGGPLLPGQLLSIPGDLVG